ncbi:MAG: PP2C family protein-serine/threonine phosphatase [Cyanobacteria bacterium NC_groundwater_1444_Ag_S-0.65um_54_12]|nr:PP2C family protein-serine/threonine phosphatase [Cyanobacteria bacterium NC_groundwater_1444_Ag_S-0.65um_54_12]
MKSGASNGLTLSLFIIVWVLTIGVDLAVIMEQRSWLGQDMPSFRVSDSMRVTLTRNANSGITNGDKLLQMAGRAVNHPWEIQEYLRAAPRVANHSYQLSGRYGPMTINLASYRWTWGDALGLVSIPLIVGLLHLVVASMAFLRTYFHEAFRPLLLYCGAVSWAFAIPYLSASKHFAPFPWAMAALLLATGAAWHLTMAFPAPWRGMRERWYLRALPYALASSLASGVLLSYTKLRDSNLELLDFVARGAETVTWILVMLVAIGMVFNIFGTARRSAMPGARVLARLALEGAMVAFLPTLLLQSVALAFPGTPVNSLAQLSLLLLFVFPLTVYLGMTRLRLTEIQQRMEQLTIMILAGAGLLLAYVGTIATLTGISLLTRWDGKPFHYLATIIVVVLCPLLLTGTKKSIDYLLERKQAHFGQVVGEFAQAIRNLVTNEDLLKALAARCERAFQPRYLVAYWKDDQSGQLTPELVLGLSVDRVQALRNEDPAYPQRVGPFTLRELDSQARSEKRISGLALALRSNSPDSLYGLIVLGPRRSGEPYAPDDNELLNLLGDQLQVGLEHVQLIRKVTEQEKTRHELEIARQVQLGLLPKQLPKVAGFSVSGSSDPALEVGGDLYDVVALAGGRIGILIGDVSGKGMPAALLMTSALSCFRTAVQSYDSPAALVTRMNEVICSHTPHEGMFVAACYAICDPSGQLVIANAGMPRPLRNGEEIPAKGPPLGIMKGYTYQELTLPMANNDLVLFWSDGLEDVHDAHGKVLGFERLLATARSNGQNAESLHIALLKAATAFRGAARPFDDITIVTFQVRTAGMLHTGNLLAPRKVLRPPTRL